jgi:hypothetical protein
MLFIPKTLRPRTWTGTWDVHVRNIVSACIIVVQAKYFNVIGWGGNEIQFGYRKDAGG